jgi:CRISPR-associated protein Csd1
MTKIQSEKPWRSKAMLDLLIEYAVRNNLVLEPGVTRKSVKWLITCTEDGRYTGIVPIGDKKGESLVCPITPAMNSGNKSHFLAETLETMVLYVEDESKINSSKVKQTYFLNLLINAAKEIPVLSAGVRLLEDQSCFPEIHRQLKSLGADPTDIATLRVGDRTVLKEKVWREWWANTRASLASDKKAKPKKTSSVCVVTGNLVEPAKTHPPIKHMVSVGGAKGGDVLVGFDKSAFTSYGFDQSLNAAMSEETAAAYTAALNHLLESRSVRLGNTLATYWFTGQVDIAAADEVMAWFVEPPEQTAGAAERRAHELLNSIRTGQRPDLTGSRFVSLLLSGAAGRVMVREVMQGSFEELVVHTEAWFRDFAIVARDGKELARDPKFLAVAGSLVRELKDLPSPWLQQLWRAAISGGLIPAATLAQAVTRTRIDIIQDTPASHARMALIKAYLIRNRGDNNMKPHMNPDHPHPAYHCGRALALFARLQRAALGDVGAGVVQRYYTAAAQTPGLILGRLASNAKNHLAKLDGGLAWWYENQLAGIMSHIGDFVPRTLILEEQSLFALGYYQQLAALNAGKQVVPESESTPSN